MRKTFPGYYRPTDEELKELWQNGFFVLDSCVLLNLYHFSTSTRVELFDILDKIQGQLWLPHQVGLEYQRNREKKIGDGISAYNDWIKLLQEVSGTFTKLTKSLKDHKQHPYISDISLIAEMKDLKQKLGKELEKGKKELTELKSDDTIRNRISDLFEDRIGPVYTNRSYAVDDRT